MANEKTMRSYFHLIQNELNVVAGACGNVEVILKKIKADTNPLELKDIIFSKIQEIQKSSQIASGAISKIKIPNYMLIDVDVSLDALDVQIKEKYKNITVRVIEGDKTQRGLYEGVLGKWDFQFGFSDSFEEAIEYFNNGNMPYIVIIDRHDYNPKKSDKIFTVDDVIKTMEKQCKGTQAIVISGENDQGFAQRMDSYKSVVRTLVKPVTAMMLESALSVALLKTTR